MTTGWREEFEREAQACLATLADAAAGAAPPGAATLAWSARRLQGRSFLAGHERAARLAAGVERLGAAVAGGAVPWDAATRALLREAIAITARDLRGDASPTHARAVEALLARLRHLAPPAVPSESRGTGARHLAAALAALDAPLRTVAATADGTRATPQAPARAAAQDAVRRLRGIAAIRALPPLAEVLDAADALLDGGDAPPSKNAGRALRAAADVVAEAAAAVAGGALPPSDSLAVHAFAAARRAILADRPAAAGPDVLPIQALLVPGDRAHDATAVRARGRFRHEATPLAERLRQSVADARGAADPVTRERVAADLQGDVAQLVALAESYAEAALVRVLQATVPGLDALDPHALWVLDDVGAILLDPAARVADLDASLSTLLSRAAGRQAPPTTRTMARERRPTPAATTRTPLTPERSPSGATLATLLGSGLAGLETPSGDAFALMAAEGARLPSIEEFLLHGRGALAEALALGAKLRSGETPTSPASMRELHELLQLAARD